MLPGAQALAVHDAHAEPSGPDAIVDEFGQPRLGLGYGHAVQVDLVLDGKFATCELTHRAPADSWPAETQAVGIAGLHRIDVGIEALLQYLSLIGAGESGSRLRLARRRFGAVGRAQWLRVGEGATEDIRVVVTHRHTRAMEPMEH